MKKVITKLLALTFICSLITLVFVMAPKGKTLEPKLLWEREFTEGIIEFDCAKGTGDILITADIYGKNKIMYFDAKGTLLWDKANENLSISEAVISENGEYVLYQTAHLEENVATNYFQSDIHLLNREGKELWKKPNPFGNKHAELSPTGEYIVFFGADFDETHLYDNNLTHLWSQEHDSWFLKFDPTGKYIVEGMQGIIYDIEGNEVWKFVGSNEILSISSDAEMILTKSIFTDINSEMYLNYKKGRLKIRIDNVETGTLSVDSKYVVIAAKDTIGLFDTVSFLEETELETVSERLNIKRLRFDEIKPIWSHKLEDSQLIFISSNNQYILILAGENERTENGEYRKRITKAYLFGISGELLWEQQIRTDQHRITTTNDIKYLVYQEGENGIRVLMNY